MAGAPCEDFNPFTRMDRCNPQGQCVGCAGDGDAAVAINELVSGVNIALNALPIGSCPQFDTNGSLAVDVAEIIAAVNASLLGCA
jgi:hypothetical protein